MEQWSLLPTAQLSQTTLSSWLLRGSAGGGVRGMRSLTLRSLLFGTMHLRHVALSQRGIYSTQWPLQVPCLPCQMRAVFQWPWLTLSSPLGRFFHKYGGLWAGGINIAAQTQHFQSMHKKTYLKDQKNSQDMTEAQWIYSTQNQTGLEIRQTGKSSHLWQHYVLVPTLQLKGDLGRLNTTGMFIYTMSHSSNKDSHKTDLWNKNSMLNRLGNTINLTWQLNFCWLLQASICIINGYTTNAIKDTNHLR